MNCPVCKEVKLHISERQGVEIDYCPQCRGVWLDRGELDKLVERSLQQETPRAVDAQREYVASAPAPQAPPPQYQTPRYEQPRYEQPRHGKYRDDDDDDDYGRYGKKRKKGGWLGEILDFD